MTYTNIIREHLFEDVRPFISCHASTLEKLPNGEVIAAYFGGTKEKHDDVAIWTSRRLVDGTWEAPVKVADQDHMPHWNPVLYLREDGVLFLYYKIGKEISQWKTMVLRSTDNGHTWTEPVELVPGDTIGGRGPVKNKPIRLMDGTLLAPASLEPAWDCFADLSYDGGKTWIASQTVPVDHDKLWGKGIIQPTAWESAPGVVHMLMRSMDSAMFRTDSTDGGKTWCPAYKIDMPNNNSGFDLVKMDSGVLALIYNPTVADPDNKKGKGPRTPLVIRLSRDNGVTWEDELLVDEGIKQYSYPSIIADGHDLLAVYTWRRERIAFFKVTVTA